MPAYSGGNRWVGIVSGNAPPEPLALAQLSAAAPEMVDIRRVKRLMGAPIVEIGPDLQLAVHDLRQVLRHLGRAYHLREREYEADTCRSLVKEMRQGNIPKQFPRWLCNAIMAGFSAQPRD
jgi:hypothetical protein